MNLLKHAVGIARAIFVAGSAASQGHPDRPVRIIVGYAPGVGVDPLARTVAQRPADALKQVKEG